MAIVINYEVVTARAAAIGAPAVIDAGLTKARARLLAAQPRYGALSLTLTAVPGTLSPG